MTNEHELLWAILPQGLETYFSIETFETTEEVFRITLVEKNTVPTLLPEAYRGKTITNTILKPVTVDYFPLRGRPTELVIKRRYWQFSGEEALYRRDLSLCAPGTKLEKEFASFLKELG